jgi:hypothetical protein
LQRDLHQVGRDLCRFMDDGLLDLAPLHGREFDTLFWVTLRAEWKLNEAVEGQPR